ncbi:hypothetical protein CORC01_04844 [Colletotrichum orchidophilum]|uniref:Uncharacterized protein n=1 Tax=Colletotrichum orchidophilum TaxID=1209926 RepID=A0A1G4BEZ4_9PEZI|nr:uncharacterized protein CORC01_04844 [Colletotrichum orchidophilum]OHE99943.1 hypothetical protein CORC01_04844 [Colletotrichum orchidophilum]
MAMDTVVGDGTRVEVTKEELDVGLATDVTLPPGETSVRLVCGRDCGAEGGDVGDDVKLDELDGMLTAAVGLDVKVVKIKEVVVWLPWTEEVTLPEEAVETAEAVLVAKLEDKACVMEEPEDENPVKEVLSLVEDGNIDELLVCAVVLAGGVLVASAEDVVLKKVVLPVDKAVLLLDSRLVGRTENVLLKVDVKVVIESEELNVVVLDDAAVVAVLFNVEMSVDESEVLEGRDVVDEVDILGLELATEVEEDEELVGKIDVVSKVSDVVVSNIEDEDVVESEEVEELVVFAKGQLVDVEESCVLLLVSRLLVVEKEDVVDSEEDDVSILEVEVEDDSVLVSDVEVEDEDEVEEEVTEEVEEEAEEEVEEVEVEVSVLNSEVEEEVEEAEEEFE